MINRLTVIGVGLIGGSLARALRTAGWCGEIVGGGHHLQSLQTAVELGVIDRFELDIVKAVAGADVVVVATPLGVMHGIFERVRLGAPDAIVTDVGSVKAPVIRAAERAYADIGVPTRFVPGHPIAGTEHSGVNASFAELFENRRVILTPSRYTEPGALQTVIEMWQRTGAVVEQLEAARHDQLLAATSHLPHVIAYTLMNCLHDMDPTDSVFRYAGSSLRDVTRIASSDPHMWRDIWQANRTALLQMVDRYVASMTEIRRALRDQNDERLLAWLQAGKSLRDECLISPSRDAVTQDGRPAVGVGSNKPQ